MGTRCRKSRPRPRRLARREPRGPHGGDAGSRIRFAGGAWAERGRAGSARNARVAPPLLAFPGTRRLRPRLCFRRARAVRGAEGAPWLWGPLVGAAVPTHVRDHVVPGGELPGVLSQPGSLLLSTTRGKRLVTKARDVIIGLSRVPRVRILRCTRTAHYLLFLFVDW